MTNCLLPLLDVALQDNGSGMPHHELPQMFGKGEMASC